MAEVRRQRFPPAPLGTTDGPPRLGVAPAGANMRGTAAPSPLCAAAHPSGPMANEITRRILWADDEIDLLKPHIRFLEQKGYSVTAVADGADALDALARERFDVLLIDEMMPGLGGLETLDQLKTRNVSIPVVLITKSEEETL